MAVQQHSTRTPTRPLLGPGAAPGRLLPERQAELLAILADGPMPHAFMTRAQRQALEAGRDALIDYLDAIEPDPDLEDDGTAEPYMARNETGYGAQPCYDSFAGDECEPDGDGEPSLAATTYQSDFQTAWGRGGRQDLEEECEDEGADIQSQPHDAEEDEPSLGAPETRHDQRRWSQGCGCVEHDHDDVVPDIGGWEARQAIRRARLDTQAALRRRGLGRQPYAGPTYGGAPVMLLQVCS